VFDGAPRGLGPPVISSGVGHLRHFAGVGRVQTGAVPPLVLPLVQVGGQAARADVLAFSAFPKRVVRQI
jgi:hypothetical protein